MKELNEIQFDHENIILNSNKVQGSILPKNVGELDRDVKIQKDTIIEGAVYGHKMRYTLIAALKVLSSLKKVLVLSNQSSPMHVTAK